MFVPPCSSCSRHNFGLQSRSLPALEFSTGLTKGRRARRVKICLQSSIPVGDNTLIMKRRNLILLLLVLSAGLAIGAGVSMLHDGLSAHATPTAMEAETQKLSANYSGSSKTESASLACRPLPPMDRRTTGSWYSSFGICRN